MYELDQLYRLDKEYKQNMFKNTEKMTIEEETIEEILAKKLSNFIDPKFLQQLMPFFSSAEGTKLLTFLAKRSKEIRMYPTPKDTFNAFKYCKWDDLKVVMIGYSPFTEEKYGHIQADGLAYSCEYMHEFETLPSSLQSIVKEVETDVYKGKGWFGGEIRGYSLREWAEQGVLLLNQALTTESGRYGSQISIWTPFFEYVMKILASTKTGIIYVPMGNSPYVKRHINSRTNHIIECPTPDPIVIQEFVGSGIFTKINELLVQLNGREGGIEW